jgi:hypothetical protein
MKKRKRFKVKKKEEEREKKKEIQSLKNVSACVLVCTYLSLFSLIFLKKRKRVGVKKKKKEKGKEKDIKEKKKRACKYISPHKHTPHLLSLSSINSNLFFFPY